MSLPIITVDQMREWEKATWANGQTEAEVIRRVGKVLAEQALRLTRSQELILILAGKGNNGADARAARPHLADRRVDLLEVNDPETELSRLEALLSLQPALIIDGLFGIGINRELSPAWVALIARVNGHRGRVLAVDVPSGLDAQTGTPHGAAIEAAITLTVGAPKSGLLAAAAWPYVGRLEVTPEVGLVPCPHRSEHTWVLPADFAQYPPSRASATHKGTYGHLAILAGSLGYHGAAVLATRAAVRAQPGLTTLYTAEEVYLPVASQLQAPMVEIWAPGSSLGPPYTAVLAGPGLAAREIVDSFKPAVVQLWRRSLLPLVIDASALDWVPQEGFPRGGIRVLTPHPGEAARLLRTSTDKVQADRVEALRHISRRYGDCWVVLKGHQTLIGNSTGEVSVNSSGNPYLAQGGSGDVLSGYIAGLLAQPPLQSDLFQLLRYAVWHHGAAADRLQVTRRNWGVEDLVQEIGNESVKLMN